MMPMATSAIPNPPSLSPRAPTHSGRSDHDRRAGPTPTHHEMDLPRSKITNRDAGHPSAPTAAPWHPDRFYEPGGLHSSVARKNTDNSTVPSMDPSAMGSPEFSDTSSDASYSSPPAPPRRFHSVPPPQPFPPRGDPRFFPQPQWHPPLGPGPASGGPPVRRDPRAVDSTYSDSESEDSDAESRNPPAERGPRLELQERIEGTQRKIKQLRHAMARKRKEVQKLRHRKDDMDNSFIQIFRPYLVNKSQFAVIQMDVFGERLRDMQSTRNEYYAAESTYEVIESELDAEESRLERLQTALSRLPPAWMDLIPPPPIPKPPPPPTEEDAEPGDQADSAPPSHPLLLGISAERHEDIHPLYDELLEAAGERQAAKEYVEDLEMHHERILYDLEIELHRKRVREGLGNQISEEDLHSARSSLAKVPTDAAEFEARFGITIPEDELDFLRDYEATSRRALDELEAATESLTYLRSLCLKKGVMRKHPTYHEELAIFSSMPGWSPAPQDGNMAIDPPSHPASQSGPNRTPTLAHPRFPILLSNPAHVLTLHSPKQALDQALRLPKDDPTGALRRAECMKELGIDKLMSRWDSIPDYINQWLIQRLRTSPMEAELMLAVCEGEFRVVNLRRWQEDVLYYWRLDEAANLEVALFEGAVTPREGERGVFFKRVKKLMEDGEEYESGGGARRGSYLGGGKVNSVIEGEGRVKSEVGEGPVPAAWEGRARSVRSVG